MGGAITPVHTEDAAVVAHKLHADHFAWRKYPQHINLELVRVTLSDAKKPQNGTLIDGNGAHGWGLTDAGSKLVARLLVDPLLREIVEDPAISINAPGEATGVSRAATERRRIMATAAWRAWQSGARQISESDAKGVFRVDAYVTGGHLASKVDRLREMFKSDIELRNFLEAAATAVLEKRP